MARQQTQAEVLYRFAQQLLTNADNLQIPEEVRGSPGAYKLILLFTFADMLQQELSGEATEPSQWAAGEGTRTSRRIHERWQQRCAAAELLMRGVCAVLEDVCTSEFDAVYIKSKVVAGLQALGLCEEVDTLLNSLEQHLQQT